MTMEDEMTKEETYDTHVYVESQSRALPVGMYTDEHSEVCSIRFGSSFTLNVVTPQDLLALAREIETFAQRAYDLHYNKDRETWLEAARIQEKLDDEQRTTQNSSWSQIQKKLDAWVEACKEEYDPEDTNPVRIMAELQQKLDACRVEAPLPYDPEDTVARTMAEEARWKDPNDPVNW